MKIISAFRLPFILAMLVLVVSFLIIKPTPLLAALALSATVHAQASSVADVKPTAESSEREAKLDVLEIVLGLLAGLVLFLYGVTRLSEVLKSLANERVKGLLARFTTNRFAGVATGTLATTALDSSSVTIIMVIAVVNAGLMSFEQSLGVVMGSNIGTTISSQLYAFNIDEYAPVALLTGFLLYMLTKSERWQHIGLAILGIGLVFFGLHLMGASVEPLREYEPFIGWMRGMERPLMGALVGAAVTVLLQSSSATLGLVIALASGNLITLPAGMAMMLGAEVGTCADTLVASLGRSRDAVRVGLFHLLFNLTTVSLGLLLIRPFTALVEWMSGGAEVERQIANAHVLFNVAGVVLFIGFTGWMAMLLRRLVPDCKSPSSSETSPEAKAPA